jgi:hypothetical protein
MKDYESRVCDTAEKLRGNCCVLRIHKRPDGRVFVLCRWEHEDVKDYVSWEWNPTMGFYAGHYWQGIITANVDYEQRAGIS